MSTTGTPDFTAVDTAVIILTMTGTNVACKVNGLNMVLGSIMEYEYYSKYLFRNASTGAFQETVLDDSDLINLDTESYNIFFNLVAYFAAQQQQGVDAERYDGKFFKEQYDLGVARYKAMYKAENQKPQSRYYSVPNKGYGKYIGRQW